MAEFQNKKNNDGVDKWFKFYYNFTSYVIVAIYITTIGLVMADFTDQKIDSYRQRNSYSLMGKYIWGSLLLQV
ncbi:MAG: hypothetical protein GX238_11745 [Epulopiscium sp.]|nr:hypothetical protein [Candidatus Epulonipiscium sp.]